MSARREAETKNPAAPFRERRAHIFNVDICSKSRSTRQWALMGFFRFFTILPIFEREQR
jgi:hypothetical protein